MALKLITPPSIEPVSLTEAKTHLRVDYMDQDTEINSLIAVARVYCEQFQHRAYVTQVWELWLDAWPYENGQKDVWPQGHIDIPLPPLQSVTSIEYYDTTDTKFVFDPSNYLVDVKSEPGRICLNWAKFWPTTILRPHNGICVTFTAGYGASSCPFIANIKAAMLLLLGHLYEHRESVLATGSVPQEMPQGVESLLYQNRVFD